MARQEALALADRGDDLARDVARARAELRRWVGARADDALQRGEGARGGLAHALGRVAERIAQRGHDEVDEALDLRARRRLDDLGEAARPLWGAAAALDLGKDEEYSRRTVERIRAKVGSLGPGGDRDQATP
jgi:hypothetical protein